VRVETGDSVATRIQFSGPVRCRWQSAAQLGRSILEVSTRRLLKGARRPGWNWFVEVGTQMLKRRLVTALTMHDVKEARRYLDAAAIRSPALSEVEITQVVGETVKGNWFVGTKTQPEVTVLYLHGGGYSFYPWAYANFIALVTLAAKAKTFALDYRLSPEYRFPAQLDDAFRAYRWLLENGTDSENLVLAGDSAGGNLALGLLLRARDSGLPLPALAVVLSPPTDLETEYASMTVNQDFDWISESAILQWAEWFCDSTQLRDPLISPVGADLRGLPPIYIQAGSAEILYDSIRAFADRARSQGADVVLETWKDMNHDFQMFGPDAPQSAEALRRIGEVIDLQVRKRKKMEAVSTASL
jgi:epsilon-lactone hydrolase